jgi:hypothetical protein
VDETGESVLIHIEIEAEARSGMGDRVWRYYMQLCGGSLWRTYR